MKTTMRSIITVFLICAWISICFSIDVAAGDLDTQIEQFQSDIKASKDVSKKVLKKERRLVPVAVPISNPTIGQGLAGALLYLHPKKSQESDAPTSMTGAFGMYTNSRSWAAGAFHDGYYLDDRIRFRVPVTYGEFNLKYYGTGTNSPLRENPIKYQAIGELFIPRLTFELPWKNWFLGGLYRLIRIDAKFETSSIGSDAPGVGQKQQTAGLGLVSLFDSRDSNLWPRQGNWLDLTISANGEYAGGDYDYLKTVVKWAQYFPLTNTITFIYRFDGQLVDQEAPFWDLSRIRLRGYSSGQFLDNAALTAQAEIRWTFRDRWTAQVFGGGGRIADTLGDIGSSRTNFAGGTGFRYMLVQKQKLSIGIDLAYNEYADVAVYFQVGDWLAN